MAIGNALRRHKRLLLEASVRVAWHNDRGELSFMICRAIDLSESGMRVESTEPLPVGAYVNFRFQKVEFEGSASVRSCSRPKARYVVGLEFSGGLKWKLDNEAEAESQFTPTPASPSPG